MGTQSGSGVSCSYRVQNEEREPSDYVMQFKRQLHRKVAPSNETKMSHRANYERRS